ncbi:MAG: hypothetical protein RL711_494 [Bacteroidota bacterium]|jgi:uncharacterized YigZ family protein
MEDSFNTIANTFEGLYKEKGSKFFAYAFPVQHENMVKTHVEALKKKHFDARHHCYAYIIGADKSKTRANDDGEPAHTAGTPILNQIRSSGLSNILIVVVRYFGGTKLGVPGLIAAYKLASAAVLKEAIIVEQLVEESICIHTSFEAMNEGLKLVKQYQGNLLEQTFQDNHCEIIVNFRRSYIEQVKTKIKGLQVLGIKISIVETS